MFSKTATLMLAVGVLVLPVLTGSTALGTTVGTTVYNGRTYFIDIQTGGQHSVVWFRVKPEMCSRGDFRVMNLRAKVARRDDALATICRAKEYCDGGKTVIGCGSVVGSGICLAGAVPSAGASLVVCSVVLAYAANKGLTDCVFGISGVIAGALGKEDEYTDMMLGSSVAMLDFGWIVESAIDRACLDAKADDSE